MSNTISTESNLTNIAARQAATPLTAGEQVASFSSTLGIAMDDETETGQALASSGVSAASPVTASPTQIYDSTQELLVSLLLGEMGGSGIGGMVSSLLISQMLSNQNAGTAYGVGDAQAVGSGLSANTRGEAVLNLAYSRLGAPYSQGLAGQGDYLDCSYLAMWCYGQTGVNLPRTAAEQAQYCAENGLTISKEELQPGDLVFFSHGSNGRYQNITHVAVYAGNGMIVDASSSNGQVVHRQMLGGQVMYGRPGATTLYET